MLYVFILSQVLIDLGLEEKALQSAIESRNRARQDKNWSQSDQIRDDLAKQGTVLMDLPE